MVIKEKDSPKDALAELDRLSALPLNNKQKFLVEREKRIFKAGLRGEQDSSYFLDFAYGRSDNWAIIHDLRIEWKGRVAQIDHLAINRCLEVYVLETKNFSYGVKISEQGEFDIWSGKHYVGIESPIEQNKRHIAVLEDRINAKGIAPKRFGVSIPISYVSYILMSPKSRIMRLKASAFSTDSVIKADQFESLMEKSADEFVPTRILGRLTKVVGVETMHEFANGVAAMHSPIKVDYRAKFGIANDLVAEQPATYVAEQGDCCDKCGAAVDKKVVSFCRYNRAKMGGFKVLCRDCQGAVNVSKPADKDSESAVVETASCKFDTCDKCGCEVDKKVVAYCRFNRGKLGGYRVLCRGCQVGS